MSKSVENKQETEIFQNKNILKFLAKTLALYFDMLYNIDVLIRHGGIYECINERYYENCVVMLIPINKIHPFILN